MHTVLKTVGFTTAAQLLGDKYHNGRPYLKEEDEEFLIAIPGAHYRVERKTFSELAAQEYIYFDQEKLAWLPTTKCSDER